MLDKLVSVNKLAFIPNRGLFESVLVLNKVVYFSKRNMKDHFLYLEKASDSVSWDYLLYVLKRMKFSIKWISLIKACVYSSSFSVMINGSQAIYFQSRRGLSQGEPVSPFRFNLATEWIAGMMWNACSSQNFHSFVLNDNLHVYLLQFVDDTIILGHPSWENNWTLKALLWFQVMFNFTRKLQ